jgi:hypothetical protein
VEQAAGETAAGQKGKGSYSNGKTKLATKRISNPRLARSFNKRVCQGKADSVRPPGRGWRSAPGFNFQMARNPSIVDAKRGDHFLQADFSLPIACPDLDY